MALSIDALRELVDEGRSDDAVHQVPYSPTPPLPKTNAWADQLSVARQRLAAFEATNVLQACEHAFYHVGGRLIYVEIFGNEVRRFVPFVPVRFMPVRFWRFRFGSGGSGSVRGHRECIKKTTMTNFQR